MGPAQARDGEQPYLATRDPHTLWIQSGPMALVTGDGEVQIDWESVEKYALSKGEFRTWAKLMLAIRDHTWKPLK